MIFIRWAFWAMAAFFVLEGQNLLALLMFLLGIFPLITILVIVALCVAGCTTYNMYDSFNTTEIRVNDVKVQRSAINPNNPYRREPK